MSQIWWYNPNKMTLIVPDAQVTIPCVKSLDSAKTMMESVNLKDWTYVVKSKGSKPYNFAVLEDAVAAAQKKSSHKTIYTVFQNGHAIASYMGEKELTRWTTIWERKNELRCTQNEFYYGTPRGRFCKDEQHFSEAIEVAEDKVRYTNVYIEYTKCKNGHLRTTFKRTSKVFHKDGSVYYYKKGRIEHESAASMSLYLPEEGLNVLRSELTKLRPELRQILENIPYYNLIGAFSRPTAYYAFDTFHKKCHERNNGKLYYGYYPKEIVDESKMVDTLCKRMRIPCTKTLRKLYNENPHNMDVVHWLKGVGFKDINSYQKLAGVGVHFCLHNPDKFKDFFKKFIELRTENNVVRMVEDTDFDLIKDVAQSYTTIDEDAAEFVLKKAKNFEEIHETFNRSCPTKSAMEEVMIHYTDKEQKRYNLSFDNDIRFELAYSNKDLAIIGAEMGICVGGYADSALAKHTTIVKLMKGDKYIACIEVRSNHMVQLKARFNNPVERQYKKYVDEWLDHAKLEASCYDYRSIGQPWHSTHNYAHIRPTDYCPAEHRPVLQVVKAKHVHFKHNNNWFFKSQLADERMNRIMYDPEEEAELRRYDEARPEDFPMAGFQAIDTDELPF
jgi:hypothetical protein